MHTIQLNIGSLTTPVIGGGYIEVDAILDGNGIVKKRDEEFFAVVRSKLKKELDFIGDEFKILQTFRNDGEIKVECKVFYNGSQRLYGYLLMSGTWDDNENTCSLIFQTVDKYSELEKNIDLEYNIVKSISEIAQISTESVLYTIVLPCYLGRAVEAQLYYDPDGNISLNPLAAHADWAYYVLIDTTDCGGGYFQYTYVTTTLDFNTPDYTLSVLWGDLWLKLASTVEPVLEDVPRCSRLYDVLVRLLNLADDTINISESTYSDYISDTANRLYNLLILDKSDAKLPLASNHALSEFISVKTLLQLYLDWFVLSYKLDDSNNFYLVRHSEITEPNYTTYPAHDLTDYKDSNFTNNQKIFTTDLSNKISKEVFSLEKEDSVHQYFKSAELIYDAYFDNIKEYSYETFNNNISYLISDPEEVADSGFVVLATDSSNVIYNKAYGPSDVSVRINGWLLPANILNTYIATSDRPFNLANDGEFPVICTQEKDKEVFYKNIPIYDIDLINFDYLIKTDLGLCEPTELEISFGRKFATLKMKL